MTGAGQNVAIVLLENTTQTESRTSEHYIIRSLAVNYWDDIAHH